MTWKPFLKRLVIFLILLYAIVPFAVYKIGTKPQISINVLYVPIAFAAILGAFIPLKREEIKTFDYAFSWKQAFIFGLLAYSTFLAYIFQQNMWWGYKYNLQYLLTGWMLYIVGGILLFLAVFNLNFARNFIKQLLSAFIILGAYAGGSVLLNLTGYKVANLLVHPLKLFLGPTNNVTISYNSGPAPLVSTENFSATVGPPCTGITSLILFTGLFLFVVMLDWKRINKKALLWIYPLGAAGMFIMAFLRLYLLFWIGANWSPKFALAGFHTNAGWLLFVGYFLVYFWFMYPKMLNRKL